MPTKRSQLLLLSCLMPLTACVSTPPEAYQLYSPERLLVPVSDIVSIDLTEKDHAGKLAAALAKHTPSRAVLNCASDGAACKNAKRQLASHGIATESTGAGSSVTLLYDHAEAHNCEQRYVDNSQNERNLNYESLGCSNAGNIIQMVTDKRQFADPGLLDYRDGEKTAQVYDNYVNPPAQSSASGGGGGYSGGMGASSPLIPSGSGGGSPGGQ